MDLPTELRHVYDEATQTLVLADIASTAGAKGRAYIDPHAIWERIIDKDTGVIRVVVAG